MKRQQGKAKRCGLRERVWINALTTYDPFCDGRAAFFDPCFKSRPDESVLTGRDLLVGAVCNGPDACDLHKANACLVVRDCLEQMTGKNYATARNKTLERESGIYRAPIQDAGIQTIHKRYFKNLAALLNPRRTARDKNYFRPKQ